MSPSELKALQTQINKCRLQIRGEEADKRKLNEKISIKKSELRDLVIESNEKDRNMSLALQEIRKTEALINKNAEVKMIVSEHAMLRYIERELGIDMEELQERILPKKIMKSISSFGNGEFPIGDHKVVIKNNTVVTVISKK